MGPAGQTGAECPSSLSAPGLTPEPSLSPEESLPRWAGRAGAHTSGYGIGEFSKVDCSGVFTPLFSVPSPVASPGQGSGFNPHHHPRTWFQGGEQWSPGLSCALCITLAFHAHTSSYHVIRETHLKTAHNTGSTVSTEGIRTWQSTKHHPQAAT